MVASLCFGLFLVLLAELCSYLLLRRRPQLELHHQHNSFSSPSHRSRYQPFSLPSLAPHESATVSLSRFFSHGVVCTPRNILFPKKVKKFHHFQLHQTIDMDESHSPSPPFVGFSYPSFRNFSQIRKTAIVEDEKPCCVGKEILYISIPVLDEDMWRMKMKETPFETPYSSPSISSFFSSSSQSPVSDSPPLTPMEKLPTEVCSVFLEDTIADDRNNDSNSNNGVSTSSTGSPRTSPSWRFRALMAEFQGLAY